MTTALFSLQMTGHFPLDRTMLAMGVFYGGLSQILVGFMEWKRHRPFGATAFTAFGLFWLSLLVMTLLPDPRFGQPSQDTALAAYLSLWGLFTVVLFIGALRLNRSLQLVLGSLAGFYFLQAAGVATDNRLIMAIAGWNGFLCSGLAIYTGFAQIMNGMFGRSVVPLGEHHRPASRLIRKHQS
jgi:succinate-acetate transporter protein